MTTAQAILIAALIFMAVGLMVSSYILRRPAVAFGASMAWLLTGFINYGLSAAMWDIYFGIFWTCVAMAIISALEGMMLRPRRWQEEKEERVDDIDKYVSDFENYEKKVGKYRKLTHRNQNKRNNDRADDEFSNSGRF